jgi:3-methylfumaryl-CoA hydratase
MTVAPEILAGWVLHVGRSQRLVQTLEVESLRRFAVACGFHADVEAVPPPLAHWAFFLPSAPDAEIGNDGHTKRGGFLPPVSLPRRMFAGAQMSFESPLELGEEAVLEMKVSDIHYKAGRTGDLVFVEVDKIISQRATVRVREHQTIVYRDAGAPLPLPRSSAEPADGELWCPQPVNLFRFSAATFNAHRIHYDHAYATGEEGYPALVVHGPFTAAKLAACAESHAHRRLATFEFKGIAPLFVSQPIHLGAATEPGTFAAIRCDGVTAMTAKVSYR